MVPFSAKLNTPKAQEGSLEGGKFCGNRCAEPPIQFEPPHPQPVPSEVAQRIYRQELYFYCAPKKLCCLSKIAVSGTRRLYPSKTVYRQQARCLIPIYAPEKHKNTYILQCTS
jgi:hypothetical protein